MATNRSNTGSTDTGKAQQARTKNGGHSHRDITNRGKAQDFEIWEVARAATAAQFYFEPLKIELPGNAGFLLFSDGGFGANNPTQVAIDELEDLYDGDSVGLVVSIGTARNDEIKKKPRFFMAVPSAAKDFANKATDPEVVHKRMARERPHDEYFRINDPGRLDVEPDEWKPRQNSAKSLSGSKTSTDITHAFNEWAAKTKNVAYLKDCAAKLVRCRHRRMHTPKWECFATGARFKCPAKPCEVEAFLDRRSFANHLVEHHPKHPKLSTGEVDQCRICWRYQAAGE